MQLSGTNTIFLTVCVVFGVIAPILIGISSAIVRAEDVTAWRCIKAGLLGLSGLAVAMKFGKEFQSPVLSIVAMALIWMTWIQVVLKTSIPKTFAIWAMTHGTIFLLGMAANHVFDIQNKVLQTFAQK